MQTAMMVKVRTMQANIVLQPLRGVLFFPLKRLYFWLSLLSRTNDDGKALQYGIQENRTKTKAGSQLQVAGAGAGGGVGRAATNPSPSAASGDGIVRAPEIATPQSDRSAVKFRRSATEPTLKTRPDRFALNTYSRMKMSAKVIFRRSGDL
jgi:hypothetical protein